MPFVYHTEFDIDASKLELFEVGSELELIAATLKSVLPGEVGYVSSHTLYSLDRPAAVRVIMESMWETWEDLVKHREGDYDEAKYVAEWAGDVARDEIVGHTYRQAGI